MRIHKGYIVRLLVLLAAAAACLVAIRILAGWLFPAKVYGDRRS